MRNWVIRHNLLARAQTYFTTLQRFIAAFGSAEKASESTYAVGNCAVTKYASRR
jgi:hypothetical protein